VNVIRPNTCVCTPLTVNILYITAHEQVCRGSVEERMVSRAEKKLYLNAMVAERQLDTADSDTEDTATTVAAGDDVETVVDETAASSNGSSKLSINRSAMSKSELASLIRFGSNAVFEAEQEDYTDDDLEVLLGKKTAATSSSTATSSTSTDATAGAAGAAIASADTDTSAEADAGVALSQRGTQRGLVEVDLRQLEGISYHKRGTADSSSSGSGTAAAGSSGTSGDGGSSSGSKSSASAVEAALRQLEAHTVLGKRDRKQRVVMVDGKGTGLRGSIAVLADNMSDDDSTAAAAAAAAGSSASKRVRRCWDHETTCLICREVSNHLVTLMLCISKCICLVCNIRCAAA
jgi:hypothetical protein